MELFQPKHYMFKDAKIKNMRVYNALMTKFKEDYEGTWAEIANSKLSWFRPFSKVLDSCNAPFYRWFIDGKLNIAYNCIDRHVEMHKNKVAIIFEGDLGDRKYITYLMLQKRVNKTANMLKNKFNIRKGDRVIIYMPMIVETVYCMLACAKIGAIHSIVFAGFSAEALRDRVQDAGAKLVITADGAFKKGKPYMLKPIVDEALAIGCECVKKVCIVKRNNQKIDITKERDCYYHEEIKNESSKCANELFDSEDTLFLLYTSGSTGKPKGVQHSMAGYLLWAQTTMEWIFDLKKNDTFWCTADVGWITGHTYTIYGPLAVGATTLIFEGTIAHENSGRIWNMIEDHQINQFFAVPTIIRKLNALGPQEPDKYDLTSLRVLCTAGEAIDATTWKWYYTEVGNSNASVVDSWWQTETGGPMIAPLPAATPMKPGSATLPLPGIMAEIVDEKGVRVPPHTKGYLCITKPWPSMIRAIWNDPKKYVSAYFDTVKIDEEAVYFTGDGAEYDEKGYINISGRIDDIVNINGGRIGTAEVEASIKKHYYIEESAIIGNPDINKGESLFAYLILKEGFDYKEEELLNDLNKIIEREIGKIAKLSDFVVVPNLPKTRSGKIVRRILKILLANEKMTYDISILENPKVIEEIKTILSNRKKK